MYKIMLVSSLQPVLDAFSGVESWMYQGFKEPRIVSTPDEALDALTRHHVDGMFIALPEEDRMRLIERMNEYPLIPMLLIEPTATTESVLRDAEMLRSFLIRTHADYSNDRVDIADMMQMIRHEYFRELLSGRVRDRASVLRNLLMLRSKMDPWSPVMVIELTLPEDEGYLQGKWQYGADRLEVAMRNIFGSEKDGMRTLVSVVDERRLFLTACRMIGSDPVMDLEAMKSSVRKHCEDGVAHVREYLGIELKMESEEVRDNLLSFTEKGV